MKRFAAVVLFLSIVAVPSFAKTHKDEYSVPCTTLWAAVKDTLRNSGKYGIIAIDNTELTASFNIGGTLTGKRTNSVLLNAKGDTCEMQVQTAYSGLVNNDAGDFKKRVDTSLAQQQQSPPAPAAKPDASKPDAPKPDTPKPATPNQ